jgi:hypothetical protein
MYDLQDIENRLTSINDAVFQELCDCFLLLRNDNYKAFSRIGSQAGKQKTIKGTPDTLLLLPNGKYILVEYSTNISKGVSKLKEDIKKCLDVKKTNIPLENIDEIIICINFKLNTIEMNELNNFLSEAKISLDIYTLDRLAIELKFHHRDLVYEYLGLHLDTGQIVSIDTFINEYNKASGCIATPLDNPFLHREKELKHILNLIFENDILILQGVAGVGKTKLAIETMYNFLKENTEYNAFCISYKNTNLLEDLYQNLNLEKNYILFIDDANRIDTFNQILGFYKIQRKGKLKIIITVRDYAFSMLMNICQDFAPAPYRINKLTDEQIIDIIKKEPFGITFFRQQDEIARISKGNPRLAIMAALLAKGKQLINALSDVSDLFERYFSTFIKDKEELQEPNNIKILGLIAFFYTIPINDKELITKILDNFGLDYNMFINNIDQLDKLEIVNIQYEYVKIPEQNMATFFFYKAFIKDNLLSFSTLIEKYFESNKNRFQDCIIPANNTFGYQNVMEKIQPILRNYLISISNYEDKIFNFLSLFWFYLQDETLEYIYKNIVSIPNNNDPILDFIEYENNFPINQNELFKLLNNFYYSEKNLKTALELSFEYIRKLPSKYSELIYNIRESLIFDIDDSYYGFSRQFILFELLINGLNKKDVLLTSAFCELSKTFLKFKYHHTKSRNNNTISLYDYPISNNSYIKEFRRNIWESIDNNFSDNLFKILQEYSKNRLIENKELMQYDIQYIVNIIEKHLKPDIFEHCKYVQEQIYNCKKIEIEHPKFPSFRSCFRNNLYEMYLTIDWDKYRDKENYDFNDYHEYERLKETEIRNRFVFNSIPEIKTFYKDFLYLYKTEQENNTWKYINSLDIIIDENFKRKFDVGCQLIIEVIENNLTNYLPYIVFRNNLETEEKAKQIWNIINNNNFQYKSTWELMFFEYLSTQLISKEYVKLLINSINNLNYYNIDFKKLQKYIIFDSKLFENILNIIFKKNELDGKIHLWLDTFEEYFEQLGKDFSLIKKVYLQQVLLGNHFDYHKKGFLKILSEDINFLFEYVDFIYKKNADKYHIDDDHELFIIWQVDNIENVLNDVFDFASEDEFHFSLLKDFYNSFFYNLNDTQRERAKNFLMNYYKKNYENPNKANIIIYIVRHTMNEYYDDFLLKFLSLTQNKDLFSKISWIDDVTMAFSRDTILSDIDASKWRNILSIVDKSDLGINLIPIKKYINSKIENALRSAEYERKIKYLENW